MALWEWLTNSTTKLDAEILHMTIKLIMSVDPKGTRKLLFLRHIHMGLSQQPGFSLVACRRIGPYQLCQLETKGCKGCDTSSDSSDQSQQLLR
jgi:hypothetical protein